MVAMYQKFWVLEWEWVLSGIVEDVKLEQSSAIHNWRVLRNVSKLKGLKSQKLWNIFYLTCCDLYRYLSTPERVELASALGLSETQVKTWFQVHQMIDQFKIIINLPLKLSTESKNEA